MGNTLCQEAHPSAATQNETPTTLDKKVPVAELLTGESADSPGSDASDDEQADKAKEHDIEAATVTPPPAIPLETTDIPAVPSTTEPTEGASSMGEETEAAAAAEEVEEEDDTEEEEGKKEIVLHTAPMDPRFPTTNAARYCYTAYNEYYKCKQQKGNGDQECASYARTYRSICPDEWIERWNELRESGTWFGKY